MPRDSFSHSVTVDVPLGEVWKSLDDPATWEAIGGVDRVIDAVIDSDGQLRGFSFETVVGGMKYLGQATPNAREKPHLMAWNIENSEIRGVTTVELRETAQGTELVVTLSVASKGMLSSMFFPVIAAAISHGLPRSVEEFAATLAVGD